MSTHSQIEQIKVVGDVAAVGTMLGALVQFLPAVAALFTIVWTGIRIYETDTVQRAIKAVFRRG